ncbi:MAG: RNA polymerase sigma-54 factor [Nitrospirae bacterium]|nr:MAG: RNA polymerase sigma-54 factor [Nitrospirota bacterium]
MAIETRLDLKLTQKLVLTPQLQQAIKLLQLPQLELTQAINQELIQNPFLEEVQEEPQEEIPLSSQTEPMVEEERTGTETPDDLPIPLERMMRFMVDDYFEERGHDGRDLGYFNPGVETTPSFEQFAKSSTNLYDHLNWQLRLTDTSEEIKEIAEAIIGNIDENGYLKTPLEDIAELTGKPVEKVQEALKVVQDFDPPGIGARDLKECLLIQIRSLGLEGTLVEKIIQNNLKELEKKDYMAIVKQYNATLEDVMMAVSIINELDPKPARNFASHETNYIVPDVFVERTEEGFKITLNDDGIPKIRLNSYYRRLLSNQKDLTKEERKFLTEKLRSAMWLLKSLDQRNRTIYRVTESIVKFQREFFEKGKNYLKPLNLKAVAEDINMHESTVSRVTLNKYLACEHGIFSFRFFFSSGLKNRDGQEISSTLVKDMIKKIIEQENPKKPYSDQKISDILKKQNIKIARRTVAKYREELKIPPHSKRKRVDI